VIGSKDFTEQNILGHMYAAPVVRPEILVTYPELESVLDQLTGILDDDTMRDLNYQVDVLKRNPNDVAIEFLESKGLI